MHHLTLSFAFLLASIGLVEAAPKLALAEVPLDSVHSGVTPDGMFLSADGRHVAQVVAKDGMVSLIVDGRAVGQAYEQIAKGSVCFSANGERTAFVGVRGDKKYFVTDGKEGPGQDAIAQNPSVFSPDGRHAAYVAIRQRTMALYIDGHEVAEFEGFAKEGVVFSADGNRYGFIAKREDSYFVVVDGKEGPPCEGAKGLVFGPDGKHFAYVMSRGGKFALVADHVAIGEYDGIVRHNTPVFDSPSKVHLNFLRGIQILRVELTLGSQGAEALEASAPAAR